MSTIADKLALLEKGESVDCSLSNGIIRSSKEITKYLDGTYGIFHGIDGTNTYFTRKAIIEVLEGKRDPWDGDTE